MVKLTDLSDILINLFTRRDERHNHALREITDLSAVLEKFFVKYNLQEDSDLRLISENIGQARIDVTTVAYKTRTRINIARDIKGKDFPPLLGEVYNDLEAVKRALFNPTLSNAVLGDVISKLRESFQQLLNAVSNIDYR